MVEKSMNVYLLMAMMTNKEYDVLYLLHGTEDLKITGLGTALLEE